MAAQPTIMAPDVRDRLTTLIQELLLKTQELAFEYSTLDEEHLMECPLAPKCKDIFRTTKEIYDYVRKLAQPPAGM